MHRTHRWALRSLREFINGDNGSQAVRVTRRRDFAMILLLTFIFPHASHGPLLAIDRWLLRITAGLIIEALRVVTGMGPCCGDLLGSSQSSPCFCAFGGRLCHQLYGIIQGGVFPDLRKEAADFVNKQPFFGIAVGGSLGADKVSFGDGGDGPAAK